MIQLQQQLQRQMQRYGNYNCNYNYNYNSLLWRNRIHRSLFTNTESLKRDDPYALLGLTWGATTSEIKEAYQRNAKQLHPDVNHSDTPEQAIQKFQRMKQAFEKLMNKKGASHFHHHREDLMEEWSFAIWRTADLISQDRNDVAGTKRKRPMKPVVSITNNKWGIAALGHPDGRGTPRQRADFIGDGKGPSSQTLGTGQSKWVDSTKTYQSWTPPKEIMRAGKAHIDFHSRLTAFRNDDDNDE
jgi:curved DNA-binding protein CbpA